MRRRVSALICALFASTSYASSSDWVKLTSTGSITYEARVDSFRLTKNREGKSIAVISGKTTDSKKNHIDVSQWYVSVNDCQAKMGKIVTLDTRGDYRFENDFIFGSGSVATDIAEVICGVVAKQQKATAGKGL